MDGGGRGGRYGHYGGGGGGRQQRNRRGGGGGGRGRGYRHQPYNNRSRGPPRGGRGNRFGGGQNYQDPQTVMVRQVYSFVSRVGEFKNIRESEAPEMRPVVSTTAANINDLTAVLCAEDKLEMLLKFQASTEMEGSSMERKPEEKVGKLVHLVVSCAAALPLQTPCYAALTLAVHEQVKGSQWEGFASRCVEYTMLNIARDLDTILLLGKSQAQATCRIKLMLRYLAIVGKMGIVKTFEGEEAADPNKMTVFGLLSLLVEVASAANEQHNNSTAANILSILVLSTLPYIMDYVPRDVMSEKLLKPIESILETYKSSFTPGVGVSSILLKDAQLEDDDEDEEEEEEEEDDDEEASGQICDSLQDLLKASQRLRNEGEPTRFSLPLDAPWKGLTRRSTPNPEGGETESHPITFSEEPSYLSFTHESQAITLLLGGETQLKLQCFNLEGVVFGRLPIFGSPPDPEDANDDDEDEMEEGAAKNEQLQAFVKSFSILDRYFVAETMRDCLISHESCVNATGVQQGSAKTAAEELLSVCHVFSGENSSAGLEYAIVETILALIAQSTEYGSLRHIFLSRVLLELTRLEPSRLSPALAVAMTNLFQDYLPALGPTTRDNFSRWFAFHLINTDYQWPSAYWKLWEPYATSLKPSSRGSFVRRALNVMAENVCDPAIISTQCLSETKSLAAELFGRTSAPSVTAADDGPVATLEIEIHRRIWDNDEDQTLLHDYLVGEEVSAALGGTTDQTNGGDWSRTDVLIRVIVDPARQMHEGLKNSLEKSDDDDRMADDDALSKDVHVIITDCIARYKQTLLGAIAKDAECLGGDKDEMIVLGGAFLLRRIESVASFSPSLLEAILSCLVKHRVVSDLAVLRWVLGDLGDSVTGDVVPRWWTYAADTLQESLSSLESDTTGGGSMVVDGGGMDSDEEFSSQATKLLNQMLQYAVKRVCSLLVTGQGDEKRLNPLQVELVEGMKTFALRSKLLLVSVLTSSVGMRKAMMAHEVHEMLAKSEICGSMLAGLCTGHESSSAVNLLQRSLEKV